MTTCDKKIILHLLDYIKETVTQFYNINLELPMFWLLSFFSAFVVYTEAGFLFYNNKTTLCILISAMNMTP